MEIAQCQQQKEEAFQKYHQGLGKIEATMVTEQIGNVAKASGSTAAGVTMVPSLPGSIVHSNDVNAEHFRNTMLQTPQLAGISVELSEAFVTVACSYLQSISTTVMTQPPAPPQADLQINQMQADKTEEQKDDGKATEDAKRLATEMEKDLLTDDTGDEAETVRANAKPGEVLQLKKIKKSQKQAKRDKRGQTGGSGSRK